MVPLRVTRLPSRFTFSVFTSFFLPYLHSSFLLTYFLSLPPVSYFPSLLFSTFFFCFFSHASPHLARHARFPSYCLSYILTYFLPYPIFLRTPRYARLARFTYPHVSLIFYFYTCLYILFFLCTVSFPSRFDFRFSLRRSILTFILVPLPSCLCFFLF